MGGASRGGIPENRNPARGSKRLANQKPCRLRSISPEFAKIYNVDRINRILVPDMNAMLIVVKSQRSLTGSAVPESHCTSCAEDPVGAIEIVESFRSHPVALASWYLGEWAMVDHHGVDSQG
jgi:hypothetical protein